MSESNKRRTKKTNNKKEVKKEKSKLKIFLLTLLVVIVISIGAITGIVVAIVKDAPEIEPTNIDALLNQTSFILDENGKVIEKVQTQEYRTIVDLEKIPNHLQDAFVAIEDERFEKHMGVDPKGIMSAVIDNIKARSTVRGASTITQQLARNLYLTNEKKLDRKIKEAYIALQLEKALTKDQILEAYLNRIYLGQGAYGVQEASQTYFSKNVEDLTIGESALLAGIVKSPSKYPPYKIVKPENFDSKSTAEVGQIDILGEKYIAVYNDEAVNRQKVVLMKMKELGYITEKQYEEALSENVAEHLKPGEKKIKGISSYFTDFVKSQVIDALVEKLDYTREEAEKELYTGGLKIYSTMDVDMQHKIEDVYRNFTEILFGNPEGAGKPVLISWSLDSSGNIRDERNKIIYYRQDHLFDKNFNLMIENGSFQINDDNLIINNKKLTPYAKSIDIADYYTVNEKRNLTTHPVGALAISEDAYRVGENKEIIISKDFLSKNKDFYSVDENGNLIISDDYFFRNEEGVVQPQSATVIMDHTNGQIKSLVGGRDSKGNKLLNRATSSPRQPGSSIKPIAVYLPALDNGFTAATAIDDAPHYNGAGNLWPTNWYKGYWGPTPLRKSVEQSMNVNSVKTLESIGIDTSIEYLSRMGVVNKNNPKDDNFISSSENKASNDENLAALGLGGMTRGITPLEMTAAFGSIANGGTYIEPTSFTKILDKHGNVLIDNEPKKNKVVSPQVAYLMTDILRTTVTSGTAKKAAIPNMTTAGKTGTTQENADAWFVGYTPYYVSAVWIGNDSPAIKLNQGSSMASGLWRNIMTKAHEGLENKRFDRPNGITTANICSKSGKLPGALCSSEGTIISEIFVEGTVPTAFCNAHKGIIKEKPDEEDKEKDKEKEEDKDKDKEKDKDEDKDKDDKKDDKKDDVTPPPENPENPENPESPKDPGNGEDPDKPDKSGKDEDKTNKNNN